MNTVSSNVFHRRLDVEPLYAIRAEGNYIYTKDGRKILDGGVGSGVTTIGYGHKRVTEGIVDQLQTVNYVQCTTFTSKAAEELADELVKESGMKRALLVNSGSEAVESAIKLNYHGNSLGALGLSSHKLRRDPFLPLFSPHFHHVSPCFAYRYKLVDESDEAYVKRLVDELEAKFQELSPETVAAFFAETIVGATSGCTLAMPGYFKAMREVCDRHGALFVLDEIMCGIGRTGKLHAWQWENLSSPPDIQVNGKGLAGGYAPIGAVLVSAKVIDMLSAGSGEFIN
ncbi:unnamed protein product, partial [Rotaria sp. Silwood1]